MVIIGAGFGGLETAKTLANKGVRVSVIDKHNHHLFQPLLYQVATAALTAAEIASPIRHILRKAKNVAVYMNKIVAVDTDKKIVRARSGREFTYDYLVLATGARHSYFGRDEWAKYAPGLKSIEDAREIRKRVLTAFEKAEMEDDPEQRRAWLNFVVVGAGPTGVELAGAISELAHYTLREDFEHIQPSDARIMLVDAGPKVLERFNDKLSAKAVDHLETLGVEILTNSMVKDMDDTSVTLNEEKIPTRTIIWAAGVQASRAGQWLGVETDRMGRIPVDDNLCVKDHAEIYAIGDTACYTPGGTEQSLPGIAPVAKQMGEYVGKDILRRVENRRRTSFKYKDLGTMATIGRNRAIADLRGFRLSGFPGWILWCVAHVYFLVGFRNRLLVCLQWFFSYMTYHRGVRLIIGESGIPEEEEDESKK